MGEQQKAHFAWQQQNDSLTWKSQTLSVTDSVLSTVPVSLPVTLPSAAPISLDKCYHQFKGGIQCSPEVQACVRVLGCEALDNEHDVFLSSCLGTLGYQPYQGYSSMSLRI